MNFQLLSYLTNQGAPKFQPYHLLARTELWNVRQNVQNRGEKTLPPSPPCLPDGYDGLRANYALMEQGGWILTS